jgi:hypothetical protein
VDEGTSITDAEIRVPCPHPIAFRGTVDCHLCGNIGFVLPGSRWTPALDAPVEAEELARDALKPD